MVSIKCKVRDKEALRRVILITVYREGGLFYSELLKVLNDKLNKQIILGSSICQYYRTEIRKALEDLHSEGLVEYYGNYIQSTYLLKKKIEG